MLSAGERLPEPQLSQPTGITRGEALPQNSQVTQHRPTHLSRVQEDKKGKTALDGNDEQPANCRQTSLLTTATGCVMYTNNGKWLGSLSSTGSTCECDDLCGERVGSPEREIKSRRSFNMEYVSLTSDVKKGQV